MAMKNHQVTPAIWNKNSNGIQEDNYSSDSSDEEPQVRMRVGEMYQAKVPQWQGVSDSQKLPHSKDGMLIWSPSDGVSDVELDEFCQTAKEKHSYNAEQALGMLFWHKHDTKKSLNDMQNFTPMPDDWSMEDRVLFEQAYTFHGKNFRKIQQLIPDKDISHLVKHYYTWKKTKTKTSLMDKQATKRQHDNDSDDYPSDDGDAVAQARISKSVPPTKMQAMDEDTEVKHKLPKGIHLSSDDIGVLASHSKGSEGHLASLDNNLIELKRQVQAEKQACGKLSSTTTAPPKPSELETNVTKEWSEEEKLLLAEGLNEFGEECDAISNVLATKSSSQVKDYISIKKENSTQNEDGS